MEDSSDDEGDGDNANYGGDDEWTLGQILKKFGQGSIRITLNLNLQV